MLSPDASATADDVSISELAALTSALDLSQEAATDDLKSQITVEELLQESVECLKSQRKDRLDRNILFSWTGYGDRTESLDANTKFVDEQIVKKLYPVYLKCENLSRDDRRTLKMCVNPLEAVKRAFLLNRAAVKFANIDSLMDFMFSNPVDKQNRSLVNPNELMYFVDIGGQPGGFADYLLWRRDWKTKGFGIPMDKEIYSNKRFTVGPQQFNILKNRKRYPHFFDDGNITWIDRYVRKHTPLGVHVVIADFASEVTEKKYMKETIYKPVHLGEAVIALSLLRTNGHFIMKIFDIFLPFTASLIYLLHKCFAEVFLVKPPTSRPSSAERYLICKWKNSGTETILNHLIEVNRKMFEISKSYMDITTMVPMDTLLNDKPFFDFIYKSNNLIAERQIEAMLNMLEEQPVHHSNDPFLVEKCLQKWHLQQKTEAIFDFDEWAANIANTPESSLNPQLPLSESFNVPGDKLGNEWHCIWIENTDNKNRTFFSTRNSTKVTMLDSISGQWKTCPDIGLMFPSNTFLYGEIVRHHVHFIKESSPHGFHIIDGLVLNGEDIRHLPYLTRLELCKKFAIAINNPTLFVKNQSDEWIRSTAINCKETFPLKDLIAEMEKFRETFKATQRGSSILRKKVQTSEKEPLFEVKGLLFLRHFPKINDGTNFNQTFQCKQLWDWHRPEILRIVTMEETPADGNIYLSHFCEFMNKSIELEKSNWRNEYRDNKTFPSRYSGNQRGGGSGGYQSGGNQGGGSGRGNRRGGSGGGNRRGGSGADNRSGGSGGGNRSGGSSEGNRRVGRN